MITHYPYSALGHANHGWLDTHYHFSFSDYQNPLRQGFGKLRVINDDRIEPGKGFDFHHHRDMEIITYVRSGAISHEDNQGNRGKTVAGDVQVMTAGSGIMHAESNLENIPTTLYQIWIEPNQTGLPPKWASHRFPQQVVKDSLHLLVANDGTAPLTINQDAKIYAGQLRAGQAIMHPVFHQVYLLVSYGDVLVDDILISQGDGAEITGQSDVSLHEQSNSEILIIDVRS